MKKSLLFCSALFAAIVLPVFDSHSQSYLPLSGESDLYCIYFPDGSSSLSKFNSRTNDFELREFSTERARIEKKKKSLARRIKTLKRIKKDNRVTPKEKVTFKNFHKIITGKKFKERKKKKKITKEVSKLIRKAMAELDVLQGLLSEFDECEDRELDLDRLAFGASIEILQFEFDHPRFGVPYWMFGPAIVTSLARRDQGVGEICVAVENSSGVAIREFPSESFYQLFSDLCIEVSEAFFGIQISCPVTQAGLPANSAIEWLDVRISAAKPSDSVIASYERDLERWGSVYGRPYRKKTGCRK